MDLLFIALLILLALFLVIVEALLVPGITVAAIGALASIAYATVLVYQDYGFNWAIITLTVAIALSVVTLFLAIRRKNIAKIELKSNSDSAIPNVRDSVAQNSKGVTMSRLAPMGTVIIQGNSYEAKSISGMLDPKSDVTVVGYEDNVLVVELTNNNN